MLGHRGSRLLVSFPEIVEMQARAIFEAAIEAGQRLGRTRHAGDHGAARHRQGRARPRQGSHHRRWRRAFETEQGVELAYSVGTMVELPRACLNAGQIGHSADFFSFGTNDLTQTTFGLSRDDAGRFLGEYTDKGIIQHDPFVTLDPAVGELMQIAVERGRSAGPI